MNGAALACTVDLPSPPLSARVVSAVSATRQAGPGVAPDSIWQCFARDKRRNAWCAAIAAGVSIALHGWLLSAFPGPALAQPADPNPAAHGVAIRIAHRAPRQAAPARPLPETVPVEPAVSAMQPEVDKTPARVTAPAPLVEPQRLPAPPKQSVAEQRVKPAVEPKRRPRPAKPVVPQVPAMSATAKPPKPAPAVDRPAPPRPAAEAQHASAAARTTTASKPAPASRLSIDTPSLITEPLYRSPPRPPVYPRRAIRFGQEGTVQVRARLSTSGDVIAVEVTQSSGHSLLDEAALDAVRGWAFEPARRDGRAVLAVVDLPVHFRLQP